MYAQAAFKTAADINFAGHVVSRSLGGQVKGHLMAISSLQKKAPGENLFAEGDEAGAGSDL